MPSIWRTITANTHLSSYQLPSLYREMLITKSTHEASDSIYAVSFINVNKSCCNRFGTRFNEPCSETITYHGGVIQILVSI